MVVFSINIRSSSKSLVNSDEVIQSDKLVCRADHGVIPDYSYLSHGQSNILYLSSLPVVQSGDGYSFADPRTSGFRYSETLRNIQNNVVGLEVHVESGKMRMFCNSARLSRERMYFLVKKGEGIYFSPDLRLLLKYSERKLRREISYSIMKYGESPEYYTIVKDIFAIPVSHCIDLEEAEITRVIDSGTIPIDTFQNYYRLDYTFEGGNIDSTYKILLDQARFNASRKPHVLVSGGVDSSLMNFLINEFSEREYEASYLYFGKEDSELEFARKAVKNTKAHLNVVEMKESDFLESFDSFSRRLIEPVGETSVIVGANFFRNFGRLGNGELMIDCTSADGCYGSANYLNPLFKKGIKSSIAEFPPYENIAAFLQLNNLKGQYRIAPYDSGMPDKYIRKLHEYIGPFANLWFRDKDSYNADLLKYFTWMYHLVEDNGKEADDWAKYTLFKLVTYASKQTTAKTYDIFYPEIQIEFPFMWLDILIDQGKYTWKEKTRDGEVKFTLKNILEKYIDKDFVYRKKVGLNSPMTDWVMLDDVKDRFTGLLLANDSLARSLLLEGGFKSLMKAYRSRDLHPNLKRLIISLAIQQKWLQTYDIGY